MKATQWDLFTERKDRLKTDRALTLKDNLKRRAERDALEESRRIVDTKAATLRTFIAFNFPRLKTREQADEYIAKPLACLGGFSLKDLCDLGYWDVAQAWMKELRMYRQNKNEYERLTSWSATRRRK